MPSEAIQRAHFEFVLWAIRRAGEEPLAKRIQLYRCIAEVCGEPAGRRELLRRADELEQADGKFREFLLNFEVAHAPKNVASDGGAQ